jgi:uncharacterized protein (TIGR00369 family)
MDPHALRRIFEEFIPFNRFLGMRATHIEAGLARIEIPFRDEFVGDPSRPAIHGGLLSTLADTAGGMAVWSSLSNPSARVSTIDLRVDYLLPGRLETVAAEARVLRVGSTVGVSDIRLYHPSDVERTIATAKGVYAVRVPRERREIGGELGGDGGGEAGGSSAP